MQAGHPCDGRARLERDRVDGIVRADNKRHVGLAKVVVDFVHLEHDCGGAELDITEGKAVIRTVIRNRSLGQQDVALSGHTRTRQPTIRCGVPELDLPSGHGMNSKADLDATRPQDSDNLCDGVLSFCHSHTIPHDLMIVSRADVDER